MRTLASARLVQRRGSALAEQERRVALQFAGEIPKRRGGFGQVLVLLAVDRLVNLQILPKNGKLRPVYSYFPKRKET